MKSDDGARSANKALHCSLPKLDVGLANILVASYWRHNWQIDFLVQDCSRRSCFCFTTSVRTGITSANRMIRYLISSFLGVSRISLDTVASRRMTGTAGQKRVPAEYFANSPFSLPPLAEQHRIVAKVDELMTLCDRLEAARLEREATRNRMATASLARLNAPDPDPETFQNHATFALNNLTPLTTRPDQIKALRQTILNLAVRGKLVPQDPNDEPASELLKRAKVTKAQAMIERKIRKSSEPELSESAGKDRSPIHWVWAHLHDFALVLGGKRLPTDASFSAEKTGNIYIRVTDMKDGSISAEGLQYISDDVRVRIAKYTIDREDLYITIAGTIGEVGEVPELFHGQNLTENAAKIVFREVDKKFLLLVLRSEDVQEQFQEKMKQMAQPKLALKRISGARIPIPPLAEQHRIVAKVDELMALCARLEARLTTGDETRGRLVEALLHETLVQGTPVQARRQVGRPAIYTTQDA